MTTALANLATRLTALETDLAGAATAAEVTALQTALAAAQADLTELLASNNVYSDNLTINSNATLAVAKSLGGKLAIINGSVTISQSSSMNAEDLQEVVDHMVTVTGSISYTMDVNGSTQAVFNNLTSVGNLTLDVSGAINFPVLENAAAIDFDNTHKNYVTSVEFPKLSKVTSFETNGNADTIDFSKATAITLSELANYEGTRDASQLTLNGKLDFTLDLAKLTSKTAAGAKNSIHLTISGAKEVTLPLFTDGEIDADSSEKVVLATYKGNSGDSFAKTEYLHLQAYEVTNNNLGTTSLDTLIFNGVAPSTAIDISDHPALDLTGATGLTTLTVSGKLNDVTLSGNTSLSDVTFSGEANDVSVIGATSLETLVLSHTGAADADDDEASLTITGNTELSSLTVDSLVSAEGLTISGNTSLETISFAKLASLGAGEAPVVSIKNNNLTASRVEKDTNGATSAVQAAGGTGSITTASGLKSLKTYLGKAIAATGADVYVSFDTVETYVTTEDVEDGPHTFDNSAARTSSTNNKLVVANIKAGTSDTKIPNKLAKSVNILDSDSGANATVQVTANGQTETLTKLGTETASEFLSRVDGISLTNTSVNVGTIDRATSIEITTATTTAYTATFLLGSTGYASATSTPTSYTNAMFEIYVPAQGTATVSATAQSLVNALNAATTLTYQTYTASGTYTTTTKLVHNDYSFETRSASTTITLVPKTTVKTVSTGTATATVVNRAASSSPSFRVFPSSATVFGSIVTFEKLNYIQLVDGLYGSEYTPGLAITLGSDFESSDIIEEYSTYVTTTGAGLARVSGAPNSGQLTRAEEFELDNGVDALKTNITSWL